MYNCSNINLVFDKSFRVEDIHTLNGSLDVSYIQKYVSDKKDINSIFWKKFLNDKDTLNNLAKKISNNNLAGNMMVIVKKV